MATMDSKGESHRAPSAWHPSVDPEAASTLSILNSKDNMHIYSMSGNFVDLTIIEIALIETMKALNDKASYKSELFVILVEAGSFAFDKVATLVGNILRLHGRFGDPAGGAVVVGPVLILDGLKSEMTIHGKLAVINHLTASGARKMVWHTAPFSRLRSWEFLRSLPLGAIIINDLPHDDEPYDRALDIKVSDLELFYKRHSGVPIVFIGGGILLADARDKPYAHLPVFRAPNSASFWEATFWDKLDNIALTVFQMEAILVQAYGTAVELKDVTAPWPKRCLDPTNYSREMCFANLDERAASLVRLLYLPFTDSSFPTSRASTLGCLAVGRGYETPELSLVSAEYHPSLQKRLIFKNLCADPKTYILTSSNWDQTKLRLEDRWYQHIKANLYCMPEHNWKAWLDFIRVIDQGVERVQVAINRVPWNPGPPEGWLMMLDNCKRVCKEGMMTHACEKLERHQRHQNAKRALNAVRPMFFTG
ncbi:hypothetical protein K490DRAFT_68805 [Saccharata proteae CBS 121410]|uniref:Uncharacterized protein n=1 Tax=Saccharata proteae CBS 121410 TaxID=1314787 RepID=A0A9P4LVR1_9PEZI|nr:hypothetical protein K490DRAFT_68805 [Saccharata proteae CBS 121410]